MFELLRLVFFPLGFVVIRPDSPSYEKSPIFGPAEVLATALGSGVVAWCAWKGGLGAWALLLLPAVAWPVGLRMIRNALFRAMAQEERARRQALERSETLIAPCEPTAAPSAMAAHQ